MNQPFDIMLSDCSVTKGYHARHAPLGRQNYGSLNVSEGNCKIESSLSSLVSLLSTLGNWRLLKIEDLDLGSGEWFLRGEDNTTFRISISYDEFAPIFRDFRPIAGRVTALSQPAIPLLDFLEQFQDVNSYWGNYHERHTVDLIRRCAVFQTALLSRRSSSPPDSWDNPVLIALSLRCLVLTHEISMVVSNLSSGAFEDNETHIRVERDDEWDPLIEISRSLTASQASVIDLKQDDKESLSSMLEEILQTTQRLMFRRRPEDWPQLICTLFLIKLISDNFNTSLMRWMRSLEQTSQAMKSVFAILCRLYDICSKGLHPLSRDWKREEYAKLVNDDKVLVDCFQWFNNMWLEGMSSVDRFSLSRVKVPNVNVRRKRL